MGQGKTEWWPWARTAECVPAVTRNVQVWSRVRCDRLQGEDMNRQERDRRQEEPW